MARRWIGLLGVALGLWAGGMALAQAAPVEEMQQIERLTVETDSATGTKYLLVNVKELKSLLAGEDVVNDVQKVETRGAAVNILTATTTTIKSGPGHLNHLIAVGGTMGNVTIYDNTAASGTVLFGPATPTAGGVIVADIEFAVGLTVVTAAATAISGSYR